MVVLVVVRNGIRKAHAQRPLHIGGRVYYLGATARILDFAAGVDASGFPRHSDQWLAYWDTWFMQHLNNENPPGRAPSGALLAVIRGEQPGAPARQNFHRPSLTSF